MSNNNLKIIIACLFSFILIFVIKINNIYSQDQDSIESNIYDTDKNSLQSFIVETNKDNENAEIVRNLNLLEDDIGVPQQSRQNSMIIYVNKTDMSEDNWGINLQYSVDGESFSAFWVNLSYPVKEMLENWTGNGNKDDLLKGQVISDENQDPIILAMKPKKMSGDVSLRIVKKDCYFLINIKDDLPDQLEVYLMPKDKKRAVLIKDTSKIHSYKLRLIYPRNENDYNTFTKIRKFPYKIPITVYVKDTISKKIFKKTLLFVFGDY